MNIKRGLATLAIAALSLTSLAACGSDTAQDEEKPDSLSFWYYEEDDAGQTQAWRRAAKAFEKETGVKINFERKSFTQIAQNGSQFLNSDEAPDLMESNRGNGSAGVLSTMGLLTDLGDYVKQYGWDKKVTGANAAVAKYDENGIMDGDTWYGMTSYAEFQRVYYNKDLFAKYNIKIPTTYDEFVDACQKFVDAGVTPIAADAQEYGVMWLWWQLVSKNADSKFIDNWQLYRGDVDWNSKVLTSSVKTINEWLDKGFISRNATGMKAEDTTQAFIKGEYPIYQTGTWNQGRFVKQIKSFDWDAAVMPESNYAVGCAGNLLVIPEKSHHKDLSAKFIDYVLSDDVQNFLGNAGGIPVAADTSKITDAKSKAMIEEYDSYAKDGKLSYYPDYAASNLTDAVPAEFQELVNGTKKPADVLKNIHEKYDTGVEDMGVKNTKNNRSFLSIPTPIMVRPAFGRTAPTFPPPYIPHVASRQIVRHHRTIHRKSLGSSIFQRTCNVSKDQARSLHVETSRQPLREIRSIPHPRPHRSVRGSCCSVHLEHLPELHPLAWRRSRQVGRPEKLETPVLRFDVLDFLR